MWHYRGAQQRMNEQIKGLSEPLAPTGRQRKRSGSKYFKHQRAQSLVEFALTLPVLLLIVSGAVDFGRAFFTTIILDSVVSEGLHYSAAYGGCLQYGVQEDETASSYIPPQCSGTNSIRARMRFEASQLALPLQPMPPAATNPPYSDWDTYIEHPSQPTLQYVWAQYNIDHPNTPTHCHPLNTPT